MTRTLQLTLTAFLLSTLPSVAAAQERLCDTKYEDCRAELLQLIRNETVGIDVAFWFMEDARYIPELINRHLAGVPVRILVDQRANASKRLNEEMIGYLRDGGIPMREKYTSDVLHFKMMLFHGQNVVEFSKANYNPWAFVPSEPNVSFDDEAVFFTNDDNLTNSFRRRFDDRWVDTAEFRNFANVEGPLVRRYPLYPIHRSMNFPPLQDFPLRVISRLDREPHRIDAIVFRVTDPRLSDAAIRAVARGVPVRLITEPSEYRNPLRLWMSKEIDRLWMGGAQIKIRKHEGLTHEAAVVMHGLGEVIFGSSNWTPRAAAGYSDEHNYFYDPSLGKPWFYQWFADQFDDKWNDTVNFGPFEPLPPASPAYSAPVNVSSGLSSTATLSWEGGTWAHLYDVYFGDNPDPPLVASNLELGSPIAGNPETFTVRDLLPGTTYHWRIVSKTWANRTNSGPVWSFTTAGIPPVRPYRGSAATIPGIVEAENFDDGGPSVSHYDMSAGNKGGVYRSTDVDIGPVSDDSGDYYVGWTPAGEWLKYTVNVATTATYTLETRLANLGTGAAFHVEVDGIDRTGPIAVPNTGGWQAWQTVTTAGIPLTQGQRTIRVVFQRAGSGGGVGNYNWFRLVEGGEPPPPPAPTTPYLGTPAAVPGTIQAENFDEGNQLVAHYDLTPGNKGAAYRSTNVDIGVASDDGGGYYVGWTPAGEWLKYTLNVAATGMYTLETRLANIGTGATFHIEVDGVALTGPIAVPDTGGWQSWRTITTPGISLTAGRRVLRVVLDTGGSGGGVGNYNWFRLVPGTSP
jgi:hypothetical protein